MRDSRPAMSMPELLVSLRFLSAGFVAAEIFRAAFLMSSSFAPTLGAVPLWARAFGVLAGLTLCLAYAAERGALSDAAKIGRSLRLDLLVAVAAGAWLNELVSLHFTTLKTLHAELQSANPHWTPLVLALLCAWLLFPLLQRHWPIRQRQASSPYFLPDDEIQTEESDLLDVRTQAESFAKTVLESDAHPGLIFGVDGPWGVGKTSFINLAEQYWKHAADRVIVCRFEPLRYASEPDLSERIISEMTAAIQSKVFAPEFKPAASRYTRLVKGKAEFSFLGFRLALQPSHQTADELLDDINNALLRIHRRVIVVIDDLDRLDAKMVNNVLFATRKTFKLSQATYILCYDSEVLSRQGDDEVRARAFLEKFVTAKISLFIDSRSLSDFLRRDWSHTDNRMRFVPPDTMLKLGAILSELAEILDGDTAAEYLPLIGDLRKLKRFVNALLLMQLERTDLGRTDFNIRDLINLALLHLYYPGVFRSLYGAETEGRSGTFSLVRKEKDDGFGNSTKFHEIIKAQDSRAQFLLGQLFDAGTLDLGDRDRVDEVILRSRACFNFPTTRSLERYLKLIVRFTAPEPRETYVLYLKAIERARTGQRIASILRSSEFELVEGKYSHDQFWRVLVSQSHDFTAEVAEDAINTLVELLPSYSSVEDGDRGLRQRSISSLILLLDSAGWGRTSGKRRANTNEAVEEIAWRIFGESIHTNQGLIERLASPSRGALGWYDLMLFRLQCSADRQGQVYNLHRALIVNQDKNAETSGLVSGLALLGMRKISQTIFALFKKSYIDEKQNFLAEVDALPAANLLGEALSGSAPERSNESSIDDPTTRGARNSELISVARTVIKSFVVFQLSNSQPPNGMGIGAGYYDEEGLGDQGGIASLMNAYMFDTCFSPSVDKDNALLFLDHCLYHLSSPIHFRSEHEGYVPTKAELSGGLDPIEMGRFWNRHGEEIRGRQLQTIDRLVRTPRYTASYREYLPSVLTVLDGLAVDARAADSRTDGFDGDHVSTVA